MWGGLDSVFAMVYRSRLSPSVGHESELPYIVEQHMDGWDVLEIRFELMRLHQVLFSFFLFFFFSFLFLVSAERLPNFCSSGRLSHFYRKLDSAFWRDSWIPVEVPGVWRCHVPAHCHLDAVAIA